MSLSFKLAPIVDGATGQPYVDFEGPPRGVQMQPAQARALAASLLDAAAAAESDALFYAFLHGLGWERQAISLALVKFRQLRQAFLTLPGERTDA